MEIVQTIEDLERKLQECADALTGPGGSDDALRAVFATFRMDFTGGMPPDPFSRAYVDFQMRIYEKIAGKPYDIRNEATALDPDRWRRPFPYYTESTATTGNYFGAIGFLLRALDLAPGASVLEFGPGWGITTIALARLGMKVTAVEVERNFCQVISARAKHDDVEIEVVHGDFFEAERLGRTFDAVVFFECFHHCSDHSRLLRTLHGLVRPGGKVVIAAEPIFPDYPIPWGLRMEGEALWAIRNFGWLELGFSEAYFREAVLRAGWFIEKRECADPSWATVWLLRESEAPPRANGEPPPFPLDHGHAADPEIQTSQVVEEALRRQLALIEASTSWRATAPIRAVGHLVKAAKRRLSKRSGDP